MQRRASGPALERPLIAVVVACAALLASGAFIGVATQIWFIPRWGRMTIFGIGVLAIWGWLASALVRASIPERRRPQVTASDRMAA